MAKGKAKRRHVRCVNQPRDRKGRFVRAKRPVVAMILRRRRRSRRGGMKLRRRLVLYLICYVLVIASGRFGVSGLWSRLVSLFSKCQPGMEI